MSPTELIRGEGVTVPPGMPCLGAINLPAGITVVGAAVLDPHIVALCIQAPGLYGGRVATLLVPALAVPRWDQRMFVDLLLWQPEGVAS